MTEPITIGALIDLLKSAKPETKVFFDFPSFQVPTSVESYRGHYDRPALGYRKGDWGDSDPTAQELINGLTAAISGAAFEGWKGGTFYYNSSDILFVAQRGETSDVLVTGLIDEGYKAIIRTTYMPDYY